MRLGTPSGSGVSECACAVNGGPPQPGGVNMALLDAGVDVDLAD